MERLANTTNTREAIIVTSDEPRRGVAGGGKGKLEGLQEYERDATYNDSRASTQVNIYASQGRIIPRCGKAHRRENGRVPPRVDRAGARTERNRRIALSVVL